MSLSQCRSFAGFDLATKFGWVNGSPGMSAVAPAADGLREFGDNLGKATEEASSRMKGLGVTWTGPAATAAQNSLAATADRASETGRITTNGADRLLDYGRSYEHMRNQIAFVDPAQFSLVQRAGDNISEGWQSLWGSGQDHVSIGEMNQANDSAANRALQIHQTNTETADNRFTTTAAAAPAPNPGDDRPAPSGVAPGGPTQQSPPPAVAQAGGVGDPGARAVAAPPPVSPGPAGTGTAPPNGAASPTPIPPAGGGTGTRGGGASGSKGAGYGRDGNAPIASAQAPSAGASSSGQGPGQRIPQAPGAGGGTGGGGFGGGAPGPGTDPSTRRSELGRNFGRDLASTRLAAPGGSSFGGSGRPGTSWGGVPASGGAGSGRLGWGGDPGGRSATGGWGGESGGRAGTGELRSGTRNGGLEGPGGRGALGEAAHGGRSGTGAGYGPMMGGAGGGQGDQEHRNRYLIPTDEAFDVDLTYTPPVLGPTPDETD